MRERDSIPATCRPLFEWERCKFARYDACAVHENWWRCDHFYCPRSPEVPCV